MIFHGVARGSENSFLYAGCYSPRGSLSVAQRAAWGLHVVCGQTSHWKSPKSVASAPRRPPCICENVFATRVKFRSRSVTLPTAIRCENYRRNGFTWTLPSLDRQRRHVPRPRQYREREAARAVQYRRLCVIINGQHLTCTVFRGRAYVAGRFAHRTRPA